VIDRLSTAIGRPIHSLVGWSIHRCRRTGAASGWRQDAAGSSKKTTTVSGFDGGRPPGRARMYGLGSVDQVESVSATTAFFHLFRLPSYPPTEATIAAAMECRRGLVLTLAAGDGRPRRKECVWGYSPNTAPSGRGGCSWYPKDLMWMSMDGRAVTSVQRGRINAPTRHVSWWYAPLRMGFTCRK